MIETKQRMIDSLPPYYSESPEVDAIMEGNAIEIERRRTEARDLLDQFFPNTATWGLSDWERVMALPPIPTADLAFRRKRIIARLNGAAPTTIKRLTDLVNSYVSQKNTTITEHNDQYYFTVQIPSVDNDIDRESVFEIVEEVKPAHLGVEFLFVHEQNLHEFAGGVISEWKQIELEPAEFSMPNLLANQQYGGFINSWNRSEINMEVSNTWLATRVLF